jgi:hypothetical protein
MACLCGAWIVVQPHNVAMRSFLLPITVAGISTCVAALRVESQIPRAAGVFAVVLWFFTIFPWVAALLVFPLLDLVPNGVTGSLAHFFVNAVIGNLAIVFPQLLIPGDLRHVSPFPLGIVLYTFGWMAAAATFGRVISAVTSRRWIILIAATASVGVLVTVVSVVIVRLNGRLSLDFP